MSRASRLLQVGAAVTTDFSRNITHHTIIERTAELSSGSGIMFKVSPIVPGSTGDWIDADWFEPVPQAATLARRDAQPVNNSNEKEKAK